MFGSKHYVPILKGKGGELAALKDLDPGVKDRLTPMIEVMPVPWDFDTDTPAKSLDDHLAPFAEKLMKAWGKDRVIFIDAPWIDAADVTAMGKTTIAHVMDDARRVGLQAVPVTVLGRSNVYQDAVKQAVAQDRRGVAIRLSADDFDDLPALTTDLGTIMKHLGVGAGETDIVIDFGAVMDGQATALSLAAQAMINSLPNVQQYRTLTLAASAFPPNLSGMKADSVTQLDRTEWDLWLSLWGKQKAILRMPSFGDYAIAHPDQADDMDPRLMKMSAQLRYTTDSGYLVLKGKNVKDYGFPQFMDLCRILVPMPEYSGSGYSWGDTYIQDCANDQDGPGNATTWRRVGTTHHLTLVTQQIASLP